MCALLVDLGVRTIQLDDRSLTAHAGLLNDATRNACDTVDDVTAMNAQNVVEDVGGSTVEELAVGATAACDDIQELRRVELLPGSRTPGRWSTRCGR